MSDRRRTSQGRSWLGRLARLGGRGEQSEDACLRLEISNLFASTCVAVTLLWALSFTALGRSRLALGVVAVALSGAVPLELNRRGRHRAARVWMLAWANLSILVFSLLLGPSAGVQLLFLATACAPLALFDARERGLAFVIGVLAPVVLAALAQHLALVWPPPLALDGATLRYVFVGLVATALLACGAIVLQYCKVQEQHRRRQDEHRRRSEAELNTALRESEQRYALASEASNDGLWDWNADTDRVYYSPAWKALLGYDDHEVGGSFAEWLDRVHPTDRERVERAIGDHMLGRSDRLRTEHRVLDKAGRYRWFLVKGRAIRGQGGVATRMVGWMIDVTERRVAEERLRHSEQRFRQVVSQVADALYLIRPDGRIADANERAQKELGYTHEQLCDITIFDIDPELTEQALRGMLEALREQGTLTMERNHVRADGTHYPVELRVGTVRFRRGDHLLVSARDMTERKQIEARLMLADRMVSVGTLAAGVAHEINNPLTSLMLNLELIDRQLGELADADSDVGLRLVRAVARAQQGGERVGVIVRDLKTFSRGDADTVEVVDLRRVLRSTLSLAQLELKQRATVSVEYPQGGAAVRANEARLGQVFLNLLLNALQAFEGREVARNHIELRVLRVGDRFAEVRVRDNGAGIPPSVLPRIFDPFFTTKPVGVGTGLGLFICRNIVESCDGTLTVESELGLGTTFCVRLPMARSLSATLPKVTFGTSPDGEAAPAPSAPQAPRGAPRRLRILVVDDEVSVGQTLRDVLNEHDVRLARDGETALVMLERTDPFDLVLCDRRVDERVTPTLQAQARARFGARVPRWTRMSGDLSDAGVSGVLAKPVRSEALWALLSSLSPRSELIDRKAAHGPR